MVIIVFLLKYHLFFNKVHFQSLIIAVGLACVMHAQLYFELVEINSSLTNSSRPNLSSEEKEIKRNNIVRMAWKQKESGKKLLRKSRCTIVEGKI